MNFSVIFILCLIGVCKSTELKCGYSMNTIESIEFDCANCSMETLPILNEYNKSVVTQLKIGGCDHVKVKEIVKNFPNLHSLDIW